MRSAKITYQINLSTEGLFHEILPEILPIPASTAEISTFFALKMKFSSYTVLSVTALAINHSHEANANFTIKINIQLVTDFCALSLMFFHRE